jgi:hypothetical protein
VDSVHEVESVQVVVGFIDDVEVSVHEVESVRDVESVHVVVG